MPYSLDYAWKLYLDAQYELATDICTEMLRKQPDNAAVLNCRAMSNWRQGRRMERVVLDMKRAVAAQPEVSSLRYNLAIVLSEAGEKDAAKIEFDAAIRLAPENMHLEKDFL